MNKIKYDVFTTNLPGVVPGVPSGTEDLEWFPNSSVLVYGENEAAIIDTFMTKSSNEELIKWILEHKVNLKYIYITHAHTDHFMGAGMLKTAFPSAKVIATKETKEGIQPILLPETTAQIWEHMLPGEKPNPILDIDETVDKSFFVDGSEFEIIKNGFTDTHDTTSLWIPDIKLIIAGDAVYNGVHPFLAETTLKDRENWIEVDKKLKNLNPKYVVAGHKNPDNDDNPNILDEMIEYITDFDNLKKIISDPNEVFEKMMKKYGTKINPGSLWAAVHL
ncbi:MBL fold metallo-hydrolase [Pediococcus argentinicus]|uniref:Metallo-beta-lactamase domain-containing protein n=1 Tax=Pediococcus argentinicus TaxID=480391 RepID=A0A0R2N8F1_9LACO|nr:MBL fold metallo-hydrolase [Pediococcus argentinicus]KRO22105.1 hypothetical protein IV88_GL001294 [Pediococcus argentinicus]NKZ22456.1 MBL fold metallo-hydrolase [Pediococcus argentinicus]GEP20204.1 MBL fold metallo-hydrolase [Pediococcus argentinicus]